MTSLQNERKVIDLKPKASIELFLQHAKTYVNDSGIIFVPRSDSKAFLDSHELTVKAIELIIDSLTFHDCFDGPEPDRDAWRSDAWTVAEFNPVWKGTRLYLKISINTKARRCKCLSIKPYQEKWEIHHGNKDV